MTTEFDPIIENRIIDFLHQNFGFEVFTPGLLRTENLFKPLVLKIKARGIKVITIAGTNGKGQTAHTLAQMFLNNRQTIALWTSPHILSIRERFKFKEDISYEDLENEMLEAMKVITNVSFYEFLFFVFLRLCLKEEKVEYLILEVGLGGRLDAVNHFDADCVAITSISRDHQSILGHKLRDILAEKIAVARSGRPLITAFASEYLNELTQEYIAQRHIDWIKLPATKDYFHSNIIIAEQIFSIFNPHESAKANFLTGPFKGRHEEMTFKGNTLIFIGAHNVEGMRKMLEHFSMKESFDSLDAVLFSFSKRPKKEINTMLAMLTSFSKSGMELWPTFFNHPKAVDRDVIEKISSKFIINWKNKLEDYSSTHQNKKILVCGSYYFIGEVQRFILSS